MLISILTDIALVAVALTMFCKGHYGATKQLGFAPLIVAALDASCVSAVTYMTTPVLSVLLTGLQLTVLLGSATLLYQDRVHARNKQERRRRRREILRTQAAFENARYAGEKKSARVCA